MPETLPLLLTWEETYLIEGRIKNADTEEGQPIAKELLMRLAPLYLEQIYTTRPVTIPLAQEIMIRETEAWFLRDKIQSTDRVGEKIVGIDLLRKIYAILLSFDRAKRTEEIVEQYPEAQEGTPLHTVQEWKEQQE